MVIIQIIIKITIEMLGLIRKYSHELPTMQVDLYAITSIAFTKQDTFMLCHNKYKLSQKQQV